MSPRATNSAAKLTSVQILRGLAALLVVFAHSATQISSLPSPPHAEIFGGSGVDLFFTISGFVMVLVTAGREANGFVFAKSRIIRIVPLYWLATFLTAITFLMSPAAFRNTELTLPHLALSLLFIAHANPGLPGSLSPLLRPGWTLNFEMFFYLAFFIALVVPTAHKKALVLTVITGLAVLGFVWPMQGPAEFYTNSIMLEFAYGVVIGAAYNSGLIQSNRIFGVGLAVAGFCGLAAFAPSFTSDNRFLLFGAPAAAILVGGLMLEAYGKRALLLQAVGDASYSIYLSHIFVVSFCRVAWLKLGLPVASGGGAIAFVGLAMVASTLVGIAIYALLERPMLKAFRMLSFHPERLARSGGGSAEKAQCGLVASKTIRSRCGMREAGNVIVGIVGFRCEDEIARLISGCPKWSYRSFEIHVCENGGAAAYDSLIDAVAALPSVSADVSASPDPESTRVFRLPGGQRVVLYRAKSNLGFAGGVNHILAAVDGDPDWSAFWVLNPDTEPEPEALAALLDRLFGGDYAIVGARLVHRATGRLQQYGGRWRWWLGRGYNVGYNEPANVEPNTEAIEASLNYVSGACMMASRDFIRSTGPMDERYFLFSEEVDWCLRRGRKRLGYAHAAIVHHDQGVTTGSNASMKQRSLVSVYLLERSGLLLTRKFRPFLVPLVAVFAGVFTLNYLRKGSVKHFRAALGGWAAGLRGEIGNPKGYRL